MTEQSGGSENRAEQQRGVFAVSSETFCAYAAGGLSMIGAISAMDAGQFTGAGLLMIAACGMASVLVLADRFGGPERNPLQ